jgi:hypothetical protein
MELAPLAVSTETAGLGNRIKSWISAMRLGRQSKVHWPITPNMPAPFHSLFAGDWHVDEVPPGALVYKSWRFAILPEDEPHLPAGFAVVGAGAHPIARGLGKTWWTLRGRPDDRYKFMVFPKSHSKRSSRADARHIDLEYERIPQYFRDVYGALFRRIEVQPAIAARVDEWSAKNVDARTIGVQVRTWRDDPRRHKKYYLPSVRRLERLLSAAPPDARFLVVSDSDDVAAGLVRRYGAQRVLQFPRATQRSASWQSAEGIAEDLIDMLLLARARTLFASYLSTFGEVAWWLGGTAARVEVF